MIAEIYKHTDFILKALAPPTALMTICQLIEY